MRDGTGRRLRPATRASTTGSQGSRETRLVIAARDDDDAEALRALVVGHHDLVRRIAARHASGVDQADDLVQEGMVGLLKAIRRFDPGRGVPFPAYASAVVQGEIRHHLRDRSSCLRLPEPVRQLRARLRDLADHVRADSGREPPIGALAERAGVGDRAAAAALTATVVPLDGDVPAADPDFLRSDERVDLESGLARLDDREREVVFLRYFADLTQDEIAKRVGVSQMHVSRILRGALETMRRSVA